jgi:phytoene dehydrogenase-like protein
VINFAIETSEDLKSVYYQIHSENKIPYCSSDSIFVSFSLKNDRSRAPEGWRTVTISAHTSVDYWTNLGKEKYESRKQLVSEAVLKLFDKSFPFMKDNTKLFLLSGSPETFEFYTKRFKGYVGGIPHSIKKSILRMPPNVTPFENLYMVGDTVFPGQGTPAVVLGALNVYRRILAKHK